MWTYIGEQSNGGHAQVEVNTGYDVSGWRNAASLLLEMGLEDYSLLLRDFIQFSTQNEKKLRRLYDSGEEMSAIELFYGFDDRFSELESKGRTLGETLQDWLRQQDWIDIMETDAPATIAWLRSTFPPHPRLKASQRPTLHKNMHALLFNEFHLLRNPLYALCYLFLAIGFSLFFAKVVFGVSDLYGFLTTEPNAIVAPIHAKAMPVKDGGA